LQSEAKMAALDGNMRESTRCQFEIDR